MTNREIDQAILAVARGDKEALKRLYLAFRKPVFILAFTLCKNQWIAEDVVQDTFIAISSKSHSYRAQGKGKAWILAIANNITKQYLHQNAQCCLLNEPEDLSELTADRNDFEQVIEQNLYVSQLLSALNPKERDIVILHVLVGLKHHEIAEALHMPKGSVFWSYSNALKKLKKTLRAKEEIE